MMFSQIIREIPRLRGLLLSVTGSDLTERLPPIHALRGGGMLRSLHRVLPLGRKYHPLLRLMNPSHGLVAIPFTGRQLVHPAAWHKYVAAFLLAGVNVVPEFQLLPPVLARLSRGRLIDVGANLGVYTLLLRAHSPLPLIAYEPQPFLYHLLELNVAHNRLENVRTRNVACGAEPGEIPFVLGINGEVAAAAVQTGNGRRVEAGVSDEAEGRQQGRNNGKLSAADATPGGEDFEQQALATQRHRTTVRVPVTTLDADLRDEEISLLKIDCEGFEEQVLRGALGLIRAQRPLLFIEIHPQLLEGYGSSARVVVDLLTPLYEIEYWDFSLLRRRSRLVRSILKHRTNPGYRFADAEAMLTASAQAPRPSQLYLLCRPRCAA